MRRRNSTTSAWVLAIVVALVLALVGGVGGAAAGPGPDGDGRAAGPAAEHTGQLCVVKFNDFDGDGSRDAGEPDLSGWTFEVLNDGVRVATIGTATGLSRCADLPPGQYTVVETAQPGWAPTTPGGPTQNVTVVPGQTTTAVFGNRDLERGRLCVQAFDDQDGDASRDPGEQLLRRWAFTIAEQSSGTVAATLVSATTAVCVDLKPGTYLVTETVKRGWVATTPAGGAQIVPLTVGQVITLAFGNKQCCLFFALLAGKSDNYSVADGNTAEPVTPISSAATPRYFDGRSLDHRIGHRFTLPSLNCIKSATLSITMKPLARESRNDTLTITVPGGGSWKRTIQSTTVFPTWAPPFRASLQIGLDKLPAGGGASNLLAALDRVRKLDVTVEDDTSVDHMRLTVNFCECES